MTGAFAKGRIRATKKVRAAIKDVYFNPERGGRLHYILDTYAPECGLDSELSHDEWPFLLREFWEACEFVSERMWDLQATLPARGPVSTMMTSRENAAYDALPEIVTVYRGQDAEWEPGMCWSLNRDVANWFAMRFTKMEPLVLTAEVKRADILALKLDRKEHEIITYWAEVVKREPADPVGAKEYLRLRRVREEKELETRGRRARKRLRKTTTEPVWVGPAI
jgi:hypothetical protein